jgi:hypothetical protein
MLLQIILEPYFSRGKLSVVLGDLELMQNLSCQGKLKANLSHRLITPTLQALSNSFEFLVQS